MQLKLIAVICATLWMSSEASASVISAPVFNTNEGGWNYAGIGFQANVNTSLTSFTYYNQGLIDIVYLYDANGNALQSISIPSGETAYVASINWSLSAGTQYYLLKSQASNARYATYGGTLPSNADISLTDTGIFSRNPPPTNNFSLSGNGYWVAFGDITTGAISQVSEPAISALMTIGHVGMGFGKRRKLA